MACDGDGSASPPAATRADARKARRESGSATDMVTRGLWGEVRGRLAWVADFGVAARKVEGAKACGGVMLDVIGNVQLRKNAVWGGARDGVAEQRWGSTNVLFAARCQNGGCCR